MKKFAAVLIGFFIAVNGYAQPAKDCKRFRNGRFKMTYQGKETIIVRNGNKQLQYYDGAKTPTIYAVKWIDDCTLILTAEQSRIKKLKDVPANAFLTEKITKTSPNSYTQVTSANFTKRTITTEIFKIK